MDQFSLIFRKKVKNIDLASKMKLNIMTLFFFFNHYDTEMPGNPKFP